MKFGLLQSGIVSHIFVRVITVQTVAATLQLEGWLFAKRFKKANALWDNVMFYETAMAAFQFDSSKRLLTEAHYFLTQP